VLNTLARCHARTPHFHIIFSTKHRQPFLNEQIRERVHAFLGGIVRDLKGAAISVGGVEDHVHMLVKWRTDEAIATLMREVKSRSSRWIHEQVGVRDFAWQSGYSVFSVSKSSVESVVEYIMRQEEHHRKQSFKDELIALLERHGVEWHPDYTFD